MENKAWDVAFKMADGTPGTSRLLGPQQNEAEVKKHYAEFFPAYKDITVTDPAAKTTVAPVK